VNRPAPSPGAAAPGVPLDERRASRRRLARPVLIVAAVVVFVAASAWLARFLSTENAERDALTGLLRAQAAGNAQGMIARLHGCRAEPSCVAAVRHDARVEHASGPVQILALSSPTAYTITPANGETRVAWRVGSGRPVVQCVVVQRRGNAVTGLSIELRRISAPIPNESDCPPGSKPPPAEALPAGP
jgi:hypothetical protein